MAASKKPPALLVYLFLFSLNLLFFPSLCLSADVEHIESVFSKSLVPRELSAAAGASGTGDFSCGPTKPCSNKACCGKDGWCGFGDKYCGKGCQSHCDAKADCGVNAAKPGQTCPLNVCCSEFGFCGTTSEFCGKSCQSNCAQPKPKSSPTNVRKRVVGYWEAWNDQHACGKMSVGEIPVNYLTHLIVSFGYIDSNFRIANMDGLSSDVYRNVGEIKAQNPGLKIMIALGGWTFNDPGPWQSVFPTMVSSQANRATFIKNLLGFLSEYGYDGVGKSKLQCSSTGLEIPFANCIDRLWYVPASLPPCLYSEWRRGFYNSTNLAQTGSIPELRTGVAPIKMARTILPCSKSSAKLL